MKYFNNYSYDRWSDTLETQAIRAEQYKLKEIDYIPITDAELETIKNINNLTLERLAFSFLCLAKFYNIYNPKNNDWVNVEDKYVFKLANIQTNIIKQCLFINDLKRLGLIEYSRVVDNINTNVLYINNDSPEMLHIDEFRDLGSEYLFWKGEDFVRCCECNKLIKINNPKNTSQRYCNDCKKIKDKDKYQRYNQKRK
jgi:hypothetical protein